MKLIEDLREQEQLILDELESDEVEENGTTRTDLATVREQIRDLEDSSARIQHDVAYSDVMIILREVIILEEEEPMMFGDRLQETFNNTADNLLVALQVVVLMTVARLPWVIMIAIIVLPIIYVAKKRGKKNSKTDLIRD